MQNAQNTYISIVRLVAGAIVAAFFLDFMAHAELGFTLHVIRRDALIVAGLLAFAIIARELVDKKINTNS
jgi:hypothetical protein